MLAKLKKEEFNSRAPHGIFFAMISPAGVSVYRIATKLKSLFLVGKFGIVKENYVICAA